LPASLASWEDAEDLKPRLEESNELGAARSKRWAQPNNQGVVDHVCRGTPRRRPGVLETYVCAMFNENRRPGLGEATGKNFGLFYPDKKPIYLISPS
jgi:hypothetical protein